MSRIAIENLKEGFVLAEDVKDISGRLILSKGRQLESNHIRIFKIWGIQYVSVEESCETSLPDQDVKDVEKLVRAEHTVETILQNIDTSHPAINEIFKAAVEHRYQNDLLIESEPQEKLPENFRFDLSEGLKTQIEFTEVQLPEGPEIMLEFNQILEDADTPIHNIVDVLNKSPSLAAILLKFVNSASYGFKLKIDTLSMAVAVLGAKEISSLVMGISVMRLFHDIPKELVDMPNFLRHSMACGILSRILASHKMLPHTERLFVTGLLHDIGRLVWYKYFPAQAKLLLLMSKRTGLSIYEMEDECLGINHVQIAEYLLRKWKFPASLENIIFYHHEPSRSPDQVEACIVHMADIAINAVGLGHSGEQIIPRFEAELWDQTGIRPNSLRTAISQTIEQVLLMTKLFPELAK